MAGSYEHCVDHNFKVHGSIMLENQIENLGDAYEAIEEMVEMINVLTSGDSREIYRAITTANKNLYPHYKPDTYENWLRRRNEDEA